MYNRNCNNCWWKPTNMCNCNNNVLSDSDEMLEDICNNTGNLSDFDMNNCECGFNDGRQVFPDNAVLAQSYVPYQFMDTTFKPCVGLKMGTIFPELVSPYMPGQSMEEIEFIKASNEIGKGCNKQYGM